MDSDTLTFGPWLQRRRQALHLTQRQLAQRAGCTAEMIRKIEADERRPSEDVARLLASALSLSEEDHPAFIHFARGRHAEAPAVASPPEPSLSHRLLPPSNLPHPPNPLIGRETEVEAARHVLMRDDVRLLTLSGPGGVGKTHLALAVATSLRTAFMDGSVFVNLAPINDPQLVLSAIAQVLEVKESTTQSLLQSVQSYVGPRQMLLVLDNCEQVLAAGPMLAELLAVAPRLRLLITSREVLRLRGEHEIVVSPLSLPNTDVHDLATVAESAAVRLFVTRAQAVRADFLLTQTSAPTVASICARLDGLPLALELAAARLKLLTPEALLQRLSNRLLLLTSGQRDLPPRQMTLRSTIDWSYQMLDAAEQRLFAGLGVFVGGWTLAAAAAIQGAGDQDAGMLDGLLALVNKSLVRQYDNGGEIRFTMLETLREYAIEHLAENGEAETLRERHAAHYVALIEGQAAQAWGPQRKEWQENLQLEYENARAALQWLHRSRDSGQPDAGTYAEQALRLSVALLDFWRITTPSEGRHWLETSYDAAPDAPFSLRQKALTGLGWLARERGDHGQALAYFEDALAQARQLDDAWTLGEALRGVGNTCVLQGAFARAHECFHESLEIARRSSDTFGVIFSLWSQAEAFYTQGDTDQAGTLLQESRELIEANDFLWGHAYVLHFMGYISRRQGDSIRARRQFQEAIDYLEVRGEWWLMAALLLEAYAGLETERGTTRRAACLFGAAEATRRARKDPPRPLYLRADYERDRAICDQLGEAVVRGAWAEGQAMTLEQAIAFAREGDG